MPESGIMPEARITGSVLELLRPLQERTDRAWVCCALSVLATVPLALWLAWDESGWGFFGKLSVIWIGLFVAVAVVTGLLTDRYTRQAGAAFDRQFAAGRQREQALDALRLLATPPSPEAKNTHAEELLKQLQRAGAAAPAPAQPVETTLAGGLPPPAVVGSEAPPPQASAAAARPKSYPYIPLEPDAPTRPSPSPPAATEVPPVDDLYCLHCDTHFEPQGAQPSQHCPVCGTPVKRAPRRRQEKI